MRYGVLVPCREERATTLYFSLSCLDAQTARPSVVVVVDDGSKFDVESITDWFSFAKCVKYPEEHESWVGRPELSRVFNFGLRELYKHDLDYIMILGADTCLEHSYVEKVVSRMNGKTVIASGYIEGEPIPRVPRGSGRIYNAKWFRENIGFFPEIYSWESYPIYKALAQGYSVKVFTDVRMFTRRRTRSYKETYGYAMRELGYCWWYALARCMYGCVKCSPKVGLKMLWTYVTSPYKVYDREVAEWIKRYQRQRLKAAVSRIKCSCGYDIRFVSTRLHVKDGKTWQCPKCGLVIRFKWLGMVHEVISESLCLTSLSDKGLEVALKRFMKQGLLRKTEDGSYISTEKGKKLAKEYEAYILLDRAIEKLGVENVKNLLLRALNGVNEGEYS